MNPYLETPDIWSDFHVTLIVAIRAGLNERLPAGYIASTDRHVRIEAPKGRRRVREPDVFVSRVPGDTATTTLAAKAPGPTTITLPMPDRKGRPYLKILDARDRRVVTVIELLSPANKTRGADHDDYLAKREEYLACGVNFVEMNLLRRWTLPPLGELETNDLQYYILACRARDLPNAAIWPFTVRERFPDFPVPLHPGAQVEFNLRPAVDRACKEGRYDHEINYRRPPIPPFDGDDARWVREIAKQSLSS
jgi:hypothetical protein